MILRSVTVTLATGKEADYWTWAEDILDLWDASGVQRAGGPYLSTGPNGEQIATWLTVHESEDAAREQFRLIYSEGEGARLIALRPALVSNSVSAAYTQWVQRGSTPPAGLALRS